MPPRQSQIQPFDNYPQLCSDAGLTCESCTEATAVELAAVCRGLAGKAIGQLFVQIYTNPACARMHSHFAACYKEASLARLEPRPERISVRRGAGRAESRALTLTAVA